EVGNGFDEEFQITLMDRLRSRINEFEALPFYNTFTHTKLLSSNH
ncbi:36558_t:CDS:1, partial [Racocetra persica]